jgi:hypothetical protein
MPTLHHRALPPHPLAQSKPHPACAPPKDATEQEKFRPFSLTITWPKGGKPELQGASASAVGVHAWCAAPELVAAVSDIQQADFKTKGLRGVHGVAGGERLLLVSPRMNEALGVFAELLKTGGRRGLGFRAWRQPLGIWEGSRDGRAAREVPSKPPRPTPPRRACLPAASPPPGISGALIDPRAKTIQPFPITPGPSYAAPRYTAACVTRLPGGGPEVYLEYGGADGWGVEKLRTLADVSAMVVPESPPPPSSPPRLVPLGSGGGALPPRAQATLACGPGGAAWAFGGLRDAGGPAKSEWRPSADLTRISVAGSAAGLSLSAAPLGPGAGGAGPAPRYGAAMVHLPPGGAAGGAAGALLLFGGINGTDPELTTDYASNLTRSPLLGDAWLFDLGSQKWAPLGAAGDTPPPMMWHGMAADGDRVLVYGGRTFDEANTTWGRDSNLYILQFPERTWQRAPVARHARTSALQTEFPNSGVVALRDRLALQSEQVRGGGDGHCGREQRHERTPMRASIP